MFKIHAEARLNLDEILEGDSELSIKLQRAMRDYRNLTAVFDANGIIFGGWSVKFLCPESEREPHDLDLFLDKRSYSSVTSLYKIGYRRGDEITVTNPENETLDLFFNGSFNSLVVDNFIDPEHFSDYCIPLTIEAINEQPAESEESSFIQNASLCGFTGEIGIQEKTKLYNEAKNSLGIPPQDIPRKLRINVPDPRLNVLFKSRSYASRKEGKDALDVRHMIDRYYHSDPAYFISSEYSFIVKANTRFKAWLLDQGYNEDWSLCNNLYTSNGVGIPRSKKIRAKDDVLHLKESLGKSRLLEVKELAAMVISAYYGTEPGYVYCRLLNKYLRWWRT